MTENSKTVAFDNAGGRSWKTRYSFLPTNYAYLDKKMLTCRSTDAANELAWVHDINPYKVDNVGINKFYNQQYHSSLKCSFNKDLSANKIYKSLSLEGTENLKGGISNFLANNTSQVSQARDANVGRLTEKGGILYAPLGRNPKVTGSNLKLAGRITGLTRVFSASGTDVDGLYGFENDAPNSTLLLLEIDFINGFNLGSNTYSVYIGIDNNAPHTNTNILSEGDTEINTKLADGLLVRPASFDVSNALISMVNTSITNGEMLLAYVLTPSEINGGDPKGQYADIDLQIGHYGYEDFELDILNLNYEHTRLDHSS
tara:strand:- start:2823 stop:3767 length:945 start_codon:yes stop_codon:yes gene_type:complete